MCVLTLKTSHRPDGEIADSLASTRLHNCGGRSGQLQGVRAAETFCEFPIAPMGNADALALILACTTATDTSVNYRGCVLKRPCKVPIAPMGISHVLRLCLQGGGVYIDGSGTVVSFLSCTITGNTAY